MIPQLPPLSVPTSSNSGDVFAETSFRSGNFGGGIDLGGLADYWPLLVVGAVGVVWYARRRRA